MARLVLINGAPASGKSTLAHLLAQERALTLVLDLDAIRGSLGRWAEDPVTAGHAARALGLAMAEAHLRSGWDVIVPQFLQRAELVLALAEVSMRTGAEFVEVALVSDPDEATRRFAARAGSTDANHRDAELLQDVPGAEPIEVMYAAMIELLRSRPATRYVRTRAGDVDGTYADLLRAVAAARETAE
ncbi:AAA family ATPase [Ruania zhangjianzhongii]|uniref:AAA family ATPase n=1 Tax=Ruania zhangjianzhongii TaxID=2603206 RepID=UPI0011C9A24B|nr:AAA family ATPase [Ruania zhangjianzhongii]